MKIIYQFYSLIIMIVLTSCAGKSYLPTVKDYDIESYMGTWYEIARLPNRFEKGLECCMATYSIKENGKINVVNTGYKIDDHTRSKSVRGTAWVPDDNFPGRLKVRFFWPFSGDYYIIYLDENYKYVLVGDPSRKYLWILSRTKTFDDELYHDLLKKAEENGFEINKVIKVNHVCD